MASSEIYIDSHATTRFCDMNESLEDQRLALIRQCNYADRDFYSETLKVGQIGKEDFFCHVTHKTCGFYGCIYNSSGGSNNIYMLLPLDYLQTRLSTPMQNCIYFYC